MITSQGTAVDELPYSSSTSRRHALDQAASGADSPSIDSKKRLENQLILACARTVVDSHTTELIKKLIASGIDWSYLIRTASRNGVMPLVCFNIVNACHGPIPPKILMECNDYWRAHAKRNLYQTAELLRLVRLLDSHRIPALPLKGPALAAYAYGNLSFRQYCDLDILVAKQDISASIELLTQNRFSLVSAPTWFQRLPIPASGKKDYGLISADGQVRVELHWRLSGPHFDLPVNLSDLWERLETVSIAGCALRTLPLEDLLLYLTLHGSRHGWERLLFICDVAEIVRRYFDDISWARLFSRASRLGSRRSLFLGLYLASDLLNAELPAEVLRELRCDAEMEPLASQVCDFLFRVDTPQPTMSYWRGYHLKVKERFRERLRLRLHYSFRYLRVALRPNAHDRMGLASRTHLSFLSYLTRPFRLIGVYGPKALSRILPRKKNH